jgi:undecaprenyl phosphate-alpha-L-ara4N flippase subunit ArnF
MTLVSSDFLTRISFRGDCCSPVGRFLVIPTEVEESLVLVFASSPRALKVRDVSTSLDMTNDTRNKPIRDRPSGFRNPWLQLGLSVVCVLISEFLLKRGATQVAEPDSAFSWTGINGLASPLVWWAILLIIASFISWLYVLRYIPLTIAFPLSRVVDILVPLGCWIFLGESISPLRWCGIALVIIGLALVAKPIAQIEERL